MHSRPLLKKKIYKDFQNHRRLGLGHHFLKRNFCSVSYRPLIKQSICSFREKCLIKWERNVQKKRNTPCNLNPKMLLYKKIPPKNISSKFLKTGFNLHEFINSLLRKINECFWAESNFSGPVQKKFEAADHPALSLCKN